ncbi:MAG: glycosyltransferase [Phycisphaerales bacterium]|nr:glycosyltransferase [Phycisphaerales bacterium]
MSLLTCEPLPTRESRSGPYKQFIEQHQRSVRDFYDALGERQLDWNERFGYFRERLNRLIRHFVMPGSRVLDLGCGTGDLLEALGPSRGVGVDCSGKMIDLAQRRHPNLTFAVGYGESLGEADVPDGPYDYITLVNVIGEMSDIGTTLRQLHRYCSAHTRIIIVQYNYLWEPICRLAARLGLKLDNPTPNWLTPAAMEGLLHISGYEVVRKGRTMPLPIRIPGLNWLCNSVLGKMYGTRALGFLSYCVARPCVPMEAPESYRCSVVVPCKNEEGNIDGLIERIPEMGAGTEIIFVDDKSTDRTAAKVRTAIEDHPQRDIKLVPGPGQGKGAACRAGFAAASGEVFMILDADMTVVPEELPAFFEAITSGRGEFINGTRLIYPLADQAMRPLNILGNKMFAGLFTLLLEQRISDTLCGTKVVWSRDYPKILAARDYFRGRDLWGDYDWIFGAAKNNLKIVELPVHYQERTAGQTKMTKRLKNAWVMLRMCGVALRKLRWI